MRGIRIHFFNSKLNIIAEYVVELLKNKGRVVINLIGDIFINPGKNTIFLNH